MVAFERLKGRIRRSPFLFNLCLRIYASAWLRFTNRRAFLRYQFIDALKKLSGLVTGNGLVGGLMTDDGDFFLRMPDGIFLFYNFRHPQWTIGDGQSLECKSGESAMHLEQFIQNKLNDNSVYFDVGANNGYFYALKVARRHPGCRVHAFEPDVRIFGPLMKNVAFNGAANVVLIPIALSDSDGTGRMPANMGASGYLLSSKTESTLQVEVRVTTLDNYVSQENIHRLDLIKVDIEGGEYRFIKGSEVTLRKLRPLVIVELREELLRRSHASVDKVVDVMGSLDYVGYRVSDHVDAVFLPREKSAPIYSVNRSWLEPI